MLELLDSLIGDESGGGEEEAVVAVTVAEDVGVRAEAGEKGDDARAAEIRVRVSEREGVGGDDEGVAGVEVDAGPRVSGEREEREKGEEEERESGSHRPRQERENARKLTRGIQGFGSFSGVGRSTAPLKESSTAFGRSHSQFNEHGNEDNIPESNSSDRPPSIFLGDQEVKPDKSKIMKGMSKENKEPSNDIIRENLHTWDNDDIGEGNSLLCGGGVLIEEENHPFNHIEKHSRVSLLAAQAEE